MRKGEFRKHLLMSERELSIRRKRKKSNLRDKFLGSNPCKVKAFMSLWVTFVIILDIDKKLASPSLFEEAHQRRLECLHVSGWNFVHLVIIFIEN